MQLAWFREARRTSEKGVRGSKVMRLDDSGRTYGKDMCGSKLLRLERCVYSEYEL